MVADLLLHSNGMVRIKCLWIRTVWRGFNLVISSTNMIAGRVCSKVFKEKTICCGLGCQGGLVCLLSIPLGFYHPLAGMAGCCCFSNFLRSNVLRVYNVEE